MLRRTCSRPARRSNKALVLWFGRVGGPKASFVFSGRLTHGLRVRRDDVGHVEMGRRTGRAASVLVRDHRARRLDARASTSDLTRVNGGVHCATNAEQPTSKGHDHDSTARQKIIRYELSFLGDDGKRYELVGQKDIRFRRRSSRSRPPRGDPRRGPSSRGYLLYEVRLPHDLW